MSGNSPPSVLITPAGMGGRTDTIYEVLQSAARVAARTAPDNDLRTLKPGNHTDLVALEADPLADISAVREIERVYRGGESVGR